MPKHFKTPTQEEYCKNYTMNGVTYTVYSTGCCFYHKRVMIVPLSVDPDKIDWKQIEKQQEDTE